MTTLTNPNDRLWALFTPNLSRPLGTNVVTIDETPQDIARNDHNLGDKITEAEETAHDRKIYESNEADETAAHHPTLRRERNNRGETGVRTPIRLGETIEKDAVETEMSGGRGVDHKGQHQPVHLGHLLEQDGNNIAMTPLEHKNMVAYIPVCSGE